MRSSWTPPDFFQQVGENNPRWTVTSCGLFENLHWLKILISHCWCRFWNVWCTRLDAEFVCAHFVGSEVYFVWNFVVFWVIVMEVPKYVKPKIDLDDDQKFALMKVRWNWFLYLFSSNFYFAIETSWEILLNEMKKVKVMADS